MALYRWSIHLAAAVAPLAADLEVTLRNTSHDRRPDHFDRPDWWASTSLLLDDVTAEMLTEVVITEKPLRAPSDDSIHAVEEAHQIGHVYVAQPRVLPS